MKRQSSRKSSFCRKKRTVRDKTPPLADGIKGFMFTSPKGKCLLDFSSNTTSEEENDTQLHDIATPISTVDESSTTTESLQPQIDTDSFTRNALLSPLKRITRSTWKEQRNSSYTSLSSSHAYQSEELQKASSTSNTTFPPSLHNQRYIPDLELDTSDILGDEAVESFYLVKSVQRYVDIKTAKGRPLPLNDSHQRMTLVLDLDETLVHCTTDKSKMADPQWEFDVTFQNQVFRVYVKTRPWVKWFLERASSIFEIVIFTASQQIYADKVLDLIDPDRKWTRYRLFRDSCVPVEGTLVKDLRILGRDLSKVIIVDNAIEAFSYQIYNGIPIKSWFSDQSDTELIKLFKFLHSLIAESDIRTILGRKFRLQERIDLVQQSQVCLLSTYATTT